MSTPTKTTFNGQLEIDHARGVIYFHSDKGNSVLRIQGLGQIPEVTTPDKASAIPTMLDIGIAPGDLYHVIHEGLQINWRPFDRAAETARHQPLASELVEP